MTYFVLCGHRRPYYPETDVFNTRDDVIRDIIADQYHEPRQVFEAVNGEMRGVSQDIARGVLQQALDWGIIDEGSLPRSAVDFCEAHLPGWYYGMVEAA